MARAAALTIAALAALGVWGADPGLAAGAVAAWGRPFELAAPSSLDVIPPQVAFSATGATSLGYGVEDIDNPASSVAFAAAGPNPRRVGRPSALTRSQRTLALAYNGSQLTILTGSSRRGLACCSFVQTLQSSATGALGPPHKLVTGLAGATVARLVALPGRLLAAIGTERGVWVAQSGAGGGFARARKLTSERVLPEELDATVAGAGSVVAYAASRANPTLPGATTAPGANQIWVAEGTAARAPQRARGVITVPAGHAIDEIALANAVRGATVAWIESWYDGRGTFHSQAMVADLGRSIRPLAVSSPAELASGIALSADAKGDQVLAWKGCTTEAACLTHATRRAARGRFGRAASLGLVDPSQLPAAATGPGGTSVVAWVQQGHVVAASAPAHAPRFTAPDVVSNTHLAADLAVSFSPLGQALATWTQGSLVESVVGALFSPR